MVVYAPSAGVLISNPKVLMKLARGRLKYLVIPVSTTPGSTEYVLTPRTAIKYCFKAFQHRVMLANVIGFVLTFVLFFIFE